MKKNFTPVFLPVLAFLMVVASMYATFVGNGTSAVMAAAPQAQTQAPLANWNEPIDVSNEDWYDNTSTVAASPLNGAVTVAWEQRDERPEYHSFGRIRHASNDIVNGDFFVQTVYSGGWKEVGNVKVKADSQGFRHMVYFKYNGSNATCGGYAIIGPDGGLASTETIPDSCNGFYKVAALAIDTDDTAHVLLGRDNDNLHYFARTAAGDWTVRDELVSEDNRPNNIAIAVTTDGTVMAAWLALNGKNDVFTGIRTSPGVWQIEDISEECCDGCNFDSNTYAPSLAADHNGGIRAAWADEECPHVTPRNTDIYYREWKPGNGWQGQDMVLVAGDADGDDDQTQQFWAAIVVDLLDRSNIIYGTDNGRGRDNYTTGYIVGSGNSFSPEERPVEDYTGGAYAKEASIAHSPGYIHSSFNSNRDDSMKDTYYVNGEIDDGTPTPTVTPIPDEPPCINERYKDVCPPDFFYDDVLALTDDNVMTGYDTVPPCNNSLWIPCFKPFTNLTRGQAVKIIALGANLPANLEGAPHFTDVPDEHTFYTFVEYAYNAGVINGYPCGGPGEPCDDQNRAYFRPGVQVTRGQFTKMVSIGFDYNDPVTTQTFEDVPPASTFYLWVERLSQRGLIGGYPCGAPAEPCVEPGNRPYFRPGNNVTRGQAAKIINGARQIVPTPTPTVAPTNTVVPTNTAVATSTAVATNTAVATTTSILPTLPIGTPTITVIARSGVRP
jgi:hypothetical protein